MTYKTTKTIGIVRPNRNYTAGDTRPATAEETQLGLALKLHEEVAGLVRSPLELSEYADVLQALRDFAEMNEVTWQQVEDATLEKKSKCGGFLPGCLWKTK